MSTSENKSISILGCGWLGLPLGIHLKDTYNIKGSTTTSEKLPVLKKAGIQPFTLVVNQEMKVNPEFLYSDILIINIPPQIRKHGVQYHVDQIKTLIPHIEKSAIKWVIYTSSTSIYPSPNDEVKECLEITEENTGNQTLLTVEQLLLKNKHFDTTILRLAGLFGPERTLVKHFAGKKNLSTGDTQVNLVHREDVIECISEIIRQEKKNDIFNICADLHPMRKDLYTCLAERSALEKPEYAKVENVPPYKIISNQKIKENLDYAFQHPDPMGFPL